VSTRKVRLRGGGHPGRRPHQSPRKSAVYTSHPVSEARQTWVQGSIHLDYVGLRQGSSKDDICHDADSPEVCRIGLPIGEAHPQLAASCWRRRYGVAGGSTYYLVSLRKNFALREPLHFSVRYTCFTGAGNVRTLQSGISLSLPGSIFGGWWTWRRRWQGCADSRRLRRGRHGCRRRRKDARWQGISQG